MYYTGMPQVAGNMMNAMGSPGMSPDIEMLKMPAMNTMNMMGGGNDMGYGRPVGPGGYGTMEQMFTRAAAPWSGGMNAGGPSGIPGSSWGAAQPGQWGPGGSNPFTALANQMGQNDPYGGGGMNAMGGGPGGYRPPMGMGQMPQNTMGAPWQQSSRFSWPGMGGQQAQPQMAPPMQLPNMGRFAGMQQPQMGMPQQGRMAAPGWQPPMQGGMNGRF